MTKRTWYSNNLQEKDALKLEKKYARMNHVVYGLTDRNLLALQFNLDLETGTGADLQLANPKDIKSLFIQTGTTEVSQLENMIVEAYHDGNLLKGISVNPHLVPSYNSD